MQPTSHSNDALPSRPFPVEAAASDHPPTPTSRRWGYPMILAALVLVGVAAVTAPMWWRGKAPGPLTTASGPVLIEFSRGEKAVWDKDDPDYFKDWEHGVAGFYDFPFRNGCSEEIEVGLAQVSCGCMAIKVAALSQEQWQQLDDRFVAEPGAPTTYAPAPNWIELAPSQDHGVTIPAGGHGAVRVGWDGRGELGRSILLKPKLWTQPRGNPQRRSVEVTLTVPVMIASNIHYHPGSRAVGLLGPGETRQGKFYLWSVTGDVKVTIPEPDADPLIDLQLERLPPAQWPAFLSQIQEEGDFKPRLRGAYVITATVHQRKQSEEIDMGRFQRTFKVAVEGRHEPLLFGVSGTARGVIDVGSHEDPGKIRLQPFSTAQGTQQTFVMWTDGKLTLAPHQDSPAAIEVKLRRLDGESIGSRAKWRLDLKVPPNALPAGTLGDDTRIVVQVTGGQERRLVRIPLVGHVDAD